MRSTAPWDSTLTEASRASREPRMMKAPAEPSNYFLRTRFPGKTWTSIAILCNPKMGLHRDLLNLRGHPNHAITLGSFTGGRVWIEDENGDAPAEVQMKSKIRALIGSWHDIRDKPITFNARRFHQVEPHEGHMWALAAYTLQAFKWLTNENAERLSSLGFPLPLRENEPVHKTLADFIPRGGLGHSWQRKLDGLEVFGNRH